MNSFIKERYNLNKSNTQHILKQQKIHFSFFKTTILAKKKIDLMLAYGKELRKYKGVGDTLQKWFSYCSGCLVNSVNSVISRKPILAIDKYISFDTQFITEKKLYWIKKKQKKLWWAVYSYHNFRRKKGLPVNGQRTKTNASTARKLKAI